MPIPEPVLNQIKCCFFNDGHIAIEPIQLKCGATACKECVNEANEEKLDCNSCKDKHEKKDLTSIPINKVAETLVHSFLQDLLEYIQIKYNNIKAAIKS
jgi:hypothetical protein